VTTEDHTDAYLTDAYSSNSAISIGEIHEVFLTRICLFLLFTHTVLAQQAGKDTAGAIQATTKEETWQAGTVPRLFQARFRDIRLDDGAHQTRRDYMMSAKHNRLRHTGFLRGSAYTTQERGTTSIDAYILMFGLRLTVSMKGTSDRSCKKTDPLRY